MAKLFDPILANMYIGALLAETNEQWVTRRYLIWMNLMNGWPRQNWPKQT